jgi:hypothetical protein
VLSSHPILCDGGGGLKGAAGEDLMTTGRTEKDTTGAKVHADRLTLREPAIALG